MYNATTIVSELSGLIGWRQNEDQSGTQLGLDLTSSSSGRYYNAEHPLLTLDNLISVSAEYARLAFTFNTWEIGTTYAVGDNVTLATINYTCTQANTGQDPSTPASVYWEVHNPFSSWLKEKTEDAILRAFSAWVTLRLGERSAASVLWKGKLDEESGDITLKDTTNGRLVGREIAPAISRNLNLKIRQIGLQFDTNEDKTILLFNSRQPQPIETITLAYTGSGGIQWFPVDWDMDGEGVYYVAYDQDAITGQSINSMRSYFQGRGGGYPNKKYNFFLTSPFTAGSYAGTLWAPSEMSYNQDSNFGLNLDITVSCDYTGLFVEQKNQFVDMLAKFVTIDMLKFMLHNPQTRVNRNQANLDRAGLQFELYGDGESTFGLVGEYNKSLKAISLNYVELDKICLPCKRKGSHWKLA